MMRVRELVEIILVARRSANRINATFTLHDERVKSLGFSAEDIEAAWKAAGEIERNAEKILAALDPAQQLGNKS